MKLSRLSYFLVCLLLLCGLDAFGQNCLPDGASYSITYAGCTVIEGDLEIDGDNITNLNAFNSITRINGDLRIISTSLQNLTGLDNLSKVGGEVYLSGNDDLINLVGLGSLSSVGEIDDPKSFTIRHADALANFQGLENLTEIFGDLSVFRVAATSFTGLTNLSQIHGSFFLTSNESLVNFIGLQNLSSIGKNLIFNYNYGLDSFDGLSGLNSIGEILEINGCTMTRIDALANLNSVERITIRSCNQLVSLNGLQNVANDLTRVQITDNDALSDIAALNAICNFLMTSDSFNVGVNAPGCDSQMEVLENCNVAGQCPTGTIGIGSQADINRFANLFSTCNILPGHLFIGGSDVVDLTVLPPIIEVGSITVSGTSLLNLEGLGALSMVNEYLDITGNNLLTSYQGLYSLPVVGSPDNPASVTVGYSQLGDLRGLETLTEIYGSLTLYEDYDLVTLEGLNNLTTVHGDVNIGENIYLETLSALQNLTSIGGTLSMNDNRILENFYGLHNLCSVGSMYITGHDLLTDITAFSNLTGSVYQLTFAGNQQLQNLNGLQGISRVEYWLSITVNSNLSDISALQNVQLHDLYWFRLDNSPLLDYCHYLNICSAINSAEIVNISANAGSCINLQAVQNICPTIVQIVFVGGNGFWNDPNMWSTGQVPDMNSEVLIPNGQIATIPANYILIFSAGAELLANGG